VWYCKANLKIPSLDLKLRKKSTVHTLLSVSTIKRNTKLTIIYVYSRDIGSQEIVLEEIPRAS